MLELVVANYQDKTSVDRVARVKPLHHLTKVVWFYTACLLWLPPAEA